MVVNNENQAKANVVFLIEATAHISPYVESLKTNYIIPTLEYFSGTIDGSDHTTEANSNSNLYGIVAFMSNDCKPDTATVCYAPTSNSNTFIQWLDKIQFIGGAGNPSSHIVEGLSTAINLLDDFQSYREQNSSPFSESTKHCILICNSTPYMEPVVENPLYCGYTIEQLMKLMTEKNISFSIFSPRKIPFLYKLFESSGGNLISAHTKNYAKDRRHLVLLNGFHLQEKPMSPSSQQPSSEQSLKRPLSPSSTSQPMLPNPQMRSSQLNTLISSETPFPQHTKMGNDMAAMTPRGAGSPWPSPNVPSPSQGPRNPNIAGPVRARAATPQMNPGSNLQTMNPIPSPGQIPNLVPQASPAGQKPAQMNQGNVALRPNNPNMNQIRPQQMHSPFSAPQAPSPSQPQPSPMGMRAVPSPLQSAPSPIPQPQQFIQQQQINQINQQQQQHQMNPMNPQNQNMQNKMQSNLQGNMQPANAANVPQPMMPNIQRARIWNGIIEYQDKSQAQKVTYHLECHVTYQNNPNEPDLTSQGWPEKLVINTVPRLLINRLSPIFKNNSYHVNLHFPQDTPGLQRLIKIMTQSQVGCIQMPAQSNIRIIVVLYMPDKKLFVGFIPHNQEEFMTSMRELIESHRKEQQVKHQQQKMLSQMGMGHPQQSSVPANQSVTNQTQHQLAQMNSNGQLSIHLSHGQMVGQSSQTASAQIMPLNSTMFQQINSNNPNLLAGPNQNIATSQAAQAPMSQATTTVQGGNILLSQSINALPSGPNQAKGFAGNTGNQMVTTTANSNMQINAPNAQPGTQQMQQQQPNLPMAQQQQQQMIQLQNAANQQQQGPGQQFNVMANSQQQINVQGNMRPANAANINAATAAAAAASAAGAGFGQSNEREQNLMTIKQLEMKLKEAQKQEMEYQMQHQHDVVVPKQSQIINQQIQQQQAQQNNAQIRQQLQHQLQQKQQMIHLQQHQHQQQQQQQQQQQHQVNLNNNIQLRHLLQQQQQQQQQMRTMNPAARMQTAVGVTQQQQPQQIMLQAGQIPQQQQQFRFQTTMQNQQQQQQPPVQQGPTAQQGRNFFEEQY